MIDRTYRCNLCRDMHPHQQLVGLYWTGKGWIEKPSMGVENHICVRCLSTLQALPERCGQGFECNGGPTCGSDHK